MIVRIPSRPASTVVLAVVSALALGSIVVAQPPAPHTRNSPGLPRTTQAPRSTSQEHLAQWMSRHSAMPLTEQQRALEREPGFHDLSPEVQQRMRNRLTQLNTMPPQQRERVLARTEAMEHLNPQQRQQVRGALSQLSSLPPERRRAVAHAFRELRDLPLSQRETALTSERYRDAFNDQERSTLSGLVAVEPYLPPPPPQPQAPAPSPQLPPQ